MPEETKWCCNCDTTKPLDAFNRHKKKPDGRQTFCRVCQRAQYGKNKDVLLKQMSERQAKAYRENPQKFLEKNRRWKAANRSKVSAMNKRYRERHPQMGKTHRDLYEQRYPERIRANRLLKKAVARGQLAKPKHCERCGKACEPLELDGHHRDYDKPLVADWLCRQCHVDVHGEERGEAPNIEPAPSP